MRPLLVAVILALTISACGAEKEAKVKSNDTPGHVVDSGTPEPTDSDSPTPAQTAPIGSTVEVGDWDVKVTKVVLNADVAMRKANEFNDRPKGQYVLVYYSATYKGTERTADADSDLSWSFTGSDKQVYDQASEVTPAEDADAPTEARTGGTVSGQAVFDLTPELIHGGTLTVEGENADFDTVYADFAIS